MKSFAFALIMLISSTLIAQSKKELVAQVAQLKAEIEKLKSEIVELKKPKEVEIKNEHQRASYGVGVIMASNLKSQGGDSLDVEVLSQGIKDFYENKTLKISQQECMPIVQQYMQAAAVEKSETMKKENAETRRDVDGKNVEKRT